MTHTYTSTYSFLKSTRVRLIVQGKTIKIKVVPKGLEHIGGYNGKVLTTSSSVLKFMLRGCDYLLLRLLSLGRILSTWQCFKVNTDKHLIN
jgi:hypothetical protein